ncbi:MAG: thymidine phosphorylase, partial [Ahniella sp.]|nr:thymidine phosphorylase [Ahniella sp.]
MQRSTSRDHRSMPIVSNGLNRLQLRRAWIDTYQQPIVYMHRDCSVSKSEGFSALTRVRIRCEDRELVATVNVVTDGRLEPDVAELSEAAWEALLPAPGAFGSFSHPEPPASTGALRAKVFGSRLEYPDFLALMQDAIHGRLSDLELAAFVTAGAGERLDRDEVLSLTKAMLAVGHRLDWGSDVVLDKHCVGGLPGNRTTPIVVAIVAAAGKLIPKTSSRAITSPAGTADTMEVMAPVELDLATMRRVVETEGGCVVWGGKVRLSPADDVLIRVERPLDFDSNGQLVASVLSKKAAAGASHVLIDIPVGPSAKVRSSAAADALEDLLVATGCGLGLNVRVIRTDGSQPVGHGIGPALEARDVLAVLRGEPGAPADLRQRALLLAGALLDLVPGAVAGSGVVLAESLLDSGQAWAKFHRICLAQGGFTEPTRAPYVAPFVARTGGRLIGIDNRRLAKVAKLAGAPMSPTAGVVYRHRLGDTLRAGEVLFDIHAESAGALDYALGFAATQEIVKLDPKLMNRVLLPFPAQVPFAYELVPLLSARVGSLDWHRFPDGESLITLDEHLLGADVAIVASLNRPDELALPLQFVAATAREFGARSVGLVAPYLAYMRQDKRFKPGQVLSAPLFAAYVDTHFDWLVTADPHLHRVHALGEIYRKPTECVATAPALAEWIRVNVADGVVIGPDSESDQWVRDVATRAGLPFQVLEKTRRGDRDVEVSLPDLDSIKGRRPIIVDDIVSSGRTAIETIRHLQRLGLPGAVCVAIHAVFAGD